MNRPYCFQRANAKETRKPPSPAERESLLLVPAWRTYGNGIEMTPCFTTFPRDRSGAPNPERLAFQGETWISDLAL